MAILSPSVWLYCAILTIYREIDLHFSVWRPRRRHEFGHTDAQDEDFDLRRSQRSLSEDGQQCSEQLISPKQPRFGGHTDAQDEEIRSRTPLLAAFTALFKTAGQANFHLGRSDQSLEAAQMVDFSLGLAISLTLAWPGRHLHEFAAIWRLSQHFRVGSDGLRPGSRLFFALGRSRAPNCLFGSDRPFFNNATTNLGQSAAHFGLAHKGPLF